MLHSGRLCLYIGLVWKGLVGVSTLAYYENLQITDQKVLQHWYLEDSKHSLKISVYIYCGFSYEQSTNRLDASLIQALV